MVRPWENGHCKVRMANPKNGREYLVSFYVLPGFSSNSRMQAIQEMELVKVLLAKIIILCAEQTVVTEESLLEQYLQAIDSS